MRDYQIDNLIAVGTSFVIIFTTTILVLRIWRRTFEAKHELRRQLIEKLPPAEVTRMLETRSITSIIEGDGHQRSSDAIGRGVMLLVLSLALGAAARTSSIRTIGYAAMAAFAAAAGQFVVSWLTVRESKPVVRD